jgi:hypothetical protein
MRYLSKFFLALLILACSYPAFAENISMTTYYPSPSGSYSDITTNLITITGNALFSAAAQKYFVGINSTRLYINPGNAFAITGMVMLSDGRIGIKTIPTIAGVDLQMVGDLQARNITSTNDTNVNNSLVVTGLSTLSGGMTSGHVYINNTLSGADNIQASGNIVAQGRLRSGLIDSNGAGLIKLTENAQVQGDLAVTAALTVTGNVTASAYMHSSDERLKEEIIPITDAVAKVQAINGVYFKYKGKDEKRMGLIAQNVEKVVPEVVATDKDGMKSVDYSSLIALLIEAVKEQQVIIDELKADADQHKVGR